MMCSEVSIDSETNGEKKADRLNRWKTTVNCWSVSFFEEGLPGNANRYAIPSELLFIFEDFFATEHIDKIFHNAPFDMCMFTNSGIPYIGGRIICTQALDTAIDENRFGNHGLKECSWDYLGLQMRSFETIFGNTPLDQFTLEQKADYASEDSWATLVLYRDKLRPIAEEEVLGIQNGDEYTLWDFYEDHIIPFNRTIFNMCRRGWKVDGEYLRRLQPIIERDIQEIDFVFNRYASAYAMSQGVGLHEYQWERGTKEKKIVSVFPGGYINPGSDDQLGFFFTEVLGHPIIKMTDGGTTGKKAISVNEEVLKTWKKDYNCNYASLVLQRRSLKKSLGTYVKGLLKWLDPHNKIHASLRVMGARTGRLACKDPNLQNIPRPDSDPYNLRGAFICDDGYSLIVADYATLEMRILAHMSGCPDLLRAIQSGQDLHCLTASRMFDIPYEDLVYAKANVHNMALPQEERLHLEELVALRQAAKAIGFGIIYGRGPQSLAEELDLAARYNLSDYEAMRRAQQLIDQFYQVYPRVQAYGDEVLWKCQRDEYVQTWLLRKRRLIAINSADGAARAQAERQALNAIIQGTASDVAMIAMNLCEYDQVLSGLGCELLMQVHDELILQVPDENLAAAKERVRQIMEDTFATHFAVPLSTGMDSAKDWASAK
jgi:DNA polymerase-1